MGLDGVVGGCAIVFARGAIFEGAVIAFGFWGAEEGTLERFFAVSGSGFEGFGGGEFFSGGFVGTIAFVGVIGFDGVDVVLFVGLLIVMGLYFILGVEEVVEMAAFGRNGVFGCIGADLFDTVLDNGIFLRTPPAEL